MSAMLLTKEMTLTGNLHIVKCYDRLYEHVLDKRRLLLVNTGVPWYVGDLVVLERCKLLYNHTLYYTGTFTKPMAVTEIAEDIDGDGDVITLLRLGQVSY